MSAKPLAEHRETHTRALDPHVAQALDHVSAGLQRVLLMLQAGRAHDAPKDAHRTTSDRAALMHAS